MDTTHLEYTAEDLIAHKLQRSGLLVAKPKFDRDGADLIALLEVADGAKFCRIQCKGRSLKNSKNSNVKILADYVSGSFFCFLYVDTGDSKTDIFCFSVTDIKKYWNQKTENKKKYYSLSIHKDKILNSSNSANLSSFLFDPTKIDLIKEDIIKSISKEEIKLIDLVKKQKILLDITKDYHKLKTMVSDIRHIEEIRALHGENLKILTQKYYDMLSEFEKELPKKLAKKINEFVKTNTPVSEIIEKVRGLIPNNISETILDDYISKVLIRRIKI